MQQSIVDSYSRQSPYQINANSTTKQEMQQLKGIVDTYSRQSPCYGTTNTNTNNLEVDDLIFEVTPFMVHLVEAVECSFSASEGSVCISELSVSSLHEVLNRLSQCGLCASVVQCEEASLYGLSIHTEAFTVDCKDNGNSINSGNEGAGDSQEECNESLLQSLRLLRQMVKVFSNIVCSISLHSTSELHITDVCLESVDCVAKTLKTINVKPKRVFSDSNSLYSFELLREDILSSPLCLHGDDDDDEEDSFAGVLNCNDYFTCLRSLRADLSASLLLRQQQHRNDNNNNSNNNSICRVRGRPRKLNYSQVVVEGEPKRKRGRPRLNDLYPLVASLEADVTTEEEGEEEEGDVASCSHSEKSSDMSHNI